MKNYTSPDFGMHRFMSDGAMNRGIVEHLDRHQAGLAFLRYLIKKLDNVGAFDGCLAGFMPEQVRTEIKCTKDRASPMRLRNNTVWLNNGRPATLHRRRSGEPRLVEVDQAARPIASRLLPLSERACFHGDLLFVPFFLSYSQPPFS